MKTELYAKLEQSIATNDDELYVTRNTVTLYLHIKCYVQAVGNITFLIWRNESSLDLLLMNK